MVVRGVAYYHDVNYAKNSKVLQWMVVGCQVAVFFLGGVEVISLLLDLRGR